MAIVFGIASALVALIYGFLKMEGVQRMLDRAALWHTWWLRRRAVKLIDILRGPKFAHMMATYPWWDLEEQIYVGRRAVTPISIRGEQISLNMARVRADLPPVDVWIQPYEKESIISRYDEAIERIEQYIADPERDGKLRPGVEVAFLLLTFMLAVAAVVSA